MVISLLMKLKAKEGKTQNNQKDSMAQKLIKFVKDESKVRASIYIDLRGSEARRKESQRKK